MPSASFTRCGSCCLFFQWVWSIVVLTFAVDGIFVSQMKAQLQAVSIRIQTMQSTAAMAESMKGAAKAMYTMNRQVNLPAMQRIMMQFEKEGEMMEMKQELMDDTIDGVMNQEGDDQQEEEVINQVLDEIGINLAADLQSAPVKTAQTQPVAAAPVAQSMGGGGGSAPGGGHDDLTARLNNLRNNNNNDDTKK